MIFRDECLKSLAVVSHGSRKESRIAWYRNFDSCGCGRFRVARLSWVWGVSEIVERFFARPLRGSTDTLAFLSDEETQPL